MICGLGISIDNDQIIQVLGNLQFDILRKHKTTLSCWPLGCKSGWKSLWKRFENPGSDNVHSEIPETNKHIRIELFSEGGRGENRGCQRQDTPSHCHAAEGDSQMDTAMLHRWANK